MKFIVSIIITALLAFAVGLFTKLPWYSFAVTSFVVGALIKQKSLLSFTAGFLAVFVLWIVLAMIKDIPNEHLLSTKVASILPLGGSWMVLLLITGLLGGLVSGFAALTASFLRGKV
ncbi:MAG: hypothetical protein K2X37_13945 [Chitinophagaceae bacterium]|jgi:hypothetical protein|nr:hypothetical protein [Chitinophagaceae bacterium]